MSDKSWNFNGSIENESKLKPLCLEVENRFRFPALRLCRYFATSEDAFFIERFGKNFRGFFMPLAGRLELPHYLERCFYRPFDELTDNYAYEDLFAFDGMVYVRSMTHQDETGFVTTYAHELQHFIQHGQTPMLARVNNVLYNGVGRLDATARAIDIPKERDANIVSKRVAEAVCGADAVRRFAEERVRYMIQQGELNEAVRWEFFRDVPTSVHYDLLQETLPFITKYKDQLDFGIDFTNPEWWLGNDEPTGESQERGARKPT